MTTAAQDVRDDLIEQDIRVRRVIGRLERDIEVRMKRFELDVLDLLYKQDPGGPNSQTERRKRLQAYEQRAEELARKAFRDVDKIIREYSERLSSAEFRVVAAALRRHVP